MMTDKVNLMGLSREELESLVESWGEPRYRARQIMVWLYHKRIDDFDAMTDLSKKFRALLRDRAYVPHLEIIAKERSSIDGTTKYLFELEDGNRIESVLMFDRNRVTLCVSSQVGCGMGCRFCQTGRIGLIRNLKAWEIIAQLMEVERDIGRIRFVTNLVLMGMGEPLANYDETMKSLRLMTAPEGLMFPARKITLSTCGLVPQMRSFTREGMKVGLAISLNASDDETRNRLMPVNRRYPIREVLDAAMEWHGRVRRLFTIEYVLLKGVNDSDEDARRLVKLFRGKPAKFNLIPFNPAEGVEFQPPDIETVEQFRSILAKEGHFVASVRFSRGADISAACGQLRARYQTG
ncbi:23S rRNA (adenine(2503)-C(2))-methyltransferase RlmN [Candidatus Poribacteria bacterium]|nr:23S rRNA (adenine(2503)-C(2))-methyltransferase RlmN [Candidatus Poribacteria bacterium]